MKSLYFLYLLFFATTLLIAQNQADTLVQQYTEKIGGKKAWKKIHAFHVEMWGRTPKQQARVEHFMLKPDCFKIIFHFASGKRTLSYSGKTGYIEDKGVIEIMPADMQVEMREEPDFFDELIFYKEKDYPLVFLQDTVINEQNFAKLALQKPENDTQFYYINRHTQLVEIIEEYSTEVKYAGTLFKTTFPEYQAVGNILFPKKMDLYGNNELIVNYTITSVVLNPKLKKKDF